MTEEEIKPDYVYLRFSRILLINFHKVAQRLEEATKQNFSDTVWRDKKKLTKNKFLSETTAPLIRTNRHLESNATGQENPDNEVDGAEEGMFQ